MSRVAFIEPGRMRTNRVYLRYLTSKTTSYCAFAIERSGGHFSVPVSTGVLKQSDLSSDTTWLVIPETHVLMN